MRTRHVPALSGLALAALLAACTDSQPAPLELNGPAVGVSMVSGNNQIGKLGTSLAQPLVISVRDGNGHPVPAQEPGGLRAWQPGARGLAQRSVVTAHPAQARHLVHPAVDPHARDRYP